MRLRILLLTLSIQHSCPFLALPSSFPCVHACAPARRVTGTVTAVGRECLSRAPQVATNRAPMHIATRWHQVRLPWREGQVGLLPGLHRGDESCLLTFCGFTFSGSL